jgi:GGDEF domain-containing protein
MFHWQNAVCLMNPLSVPVLVVVGCTLYAAAYNLAFYRRAKESPEHLWFAWMCFWVATYGVCSALLYSSTTLEVSIWLQRGQFSTIAFIALSVFALMARVAGPFLPRATSVLAAVWAAFAVAAWVDSPLFLHLSQPDIKRFTVLGLKVVYVEVEPGPLLDVFFFTVIAGMAIASVTLVRAQRADRSKDLSPFTIGLGVFFVASVHDILLGIGAIRSIYCLEYSFLVMMLVMDRSLLERFVAAFRRVARMRDELEERVKDRTKEIATLADELRARNVELSEKNEQLRALAERDSLTGLLNHAAFWRRLNAVLNMSRRQKFSISVVMVDVDNFKTMNDRLGHVRGDEVLRSVANVLAAGVREYNTRPGLADIDHSAQAVLRDYDVVARYGGDEFAIVLLYCDEDGTRAALSRVTKQVSELELALLGDMTLTLSIGACVIGDTAACTDAAALVHQADACLYEAKRQGRNRTIVSAFGPPRTPVPTGA